MRITRKELRDQWIAALRSGEYKQGKGQLRALGDTDYEFCCLGVATDIIRQMCDDPDRQEELDSFLANLSYLPGDVAGMLGMTTDQGNGSPQGDLAELNDDEGYDFEQIADTLETQPQLWFDPNADPDEIVTC